MYLFINYLSRQIYRLNKMLTVIKFVLKLHIFNTNLNANIFEKTLRVVLENIFMVIFLMKYYMDSFTTCLHLVFLFAVD